MTETTTEFEKSICAVKSIQCKELGNGLFAIYEESKFSQNYKVRIWDSNNKTYLSANSNNKPANGILSPEDYSNILLESDKYKLTVTESNEIIVNERDDSNSYTNKQVGTTYTTNIDGKNISLVVIGGVVFACIVGAAVFYFTKNPPLSEGAAVGTGEIIGGAVASKTIGKFLDIIGSYFVISLLQNDKASAEYAVAYEEAMQTYPIRRDPLLVDLDGDGIETTTTENGVFFDHQNDGFAETSAWVGEDDGILAFAA